VYFQSSIARLAADKISGTPAVFLQDMVNTEDVKLRAIIPNRNKVTPLTKIYYAKENNIRNSKRFGVPLIVTPDDQGGPVIPLPC
jgi:hypothetical protein